MNAAAKRPWYRLHWVTWLILLLVGSALVYAEIHGVTDGWEASFGYNIDTTYGWPAVQFTFREFGSYDLPQLGTPGPDYVYDWHWVAVVVDGAVCLAFLASPAFLLESWLRSPRRR